VSEWRETTLGDVIHFQRGFDLTEKESEHGPYPVISSGGVSYFTATPKVDGPGVVTGRKGVLGKVHFSQGPYWPHDTTLWVTDFKGNNPRFVYYWLKTLPLSSLDGGAANPTLNRNHAHLMRVRVPDPSTQLRIGEVLTLFDDLIENNTRRIAILEQMAQVIYREWFVHFRYPGHEEDVLVDSSVVGAIPDGWEVKEIGAVIDTLGGGTPSRREPTYWEDGRIPWFTPTDLTKAGAMFISATAATITSEGLAHSSARMFPRRSVLMTSRATIGVVSISGVEASTNQGFIVCVPNDQLCEYHVYFWLLENVTRFLTLASGATFKELTKGTFRRLPIAVPPVAIEEGFFALVSPIGDTIERLLAANVVVEALRDALLPKLVAGAIDVPELDLDALLGETPA
jgi:type I restriction enzyme S subunit